MTQYNQWYVATYKVILSMANWQDLTADLERKLVCIFSWMPQGIMNVNHSGSVKKGNLKRKSQVFNVKQAAECVLKAAPHLEKGAGQGTSFGESRGYQRGSVRCLRANLRFARVSGWIQILALLLSSSFPHLG